MSNINIAAYGLTAQLKASQTLPQGITLSEFAHDTDPFTTEDTEIADLATNINGHGVAWKKTGVIPLTINMIPGSAEDKALQVLLQRNKPRPGAAIVFDDVTITFNYPNGSTATYRNGIITSGPQAYGAAQDGNMSSRAYTFKFTTVDFVNSNSSSDIV